MKRFLCMLCVLLALICVFVACGGEETPGGTEQTPNGNEGGENPPGQSGGENGEPHTHFYGMWKVTTAASCTAKGEEKRTCACGASETREVAALSHSYSEWTLTTAATCVAEGEEKRTCACGAEEKKVIPATGVHVYGEWEVVTAVTCATKGEDKRVCTCGDLQTREVPATGKHNYGVENTCMVCAAELVYSKELTYELSEDGTGYMVKGIAVDNVASVIIPPYHNKLPVIGILSSSFSYRPDLTSVTFPDSLTHIEKDAFFECPQLINVDNGVSYVGKWVVGCETRITSVILHSNIVGIGDGAFYGCDKLNVVTIPATVKYIGYKAFYGCSALSRVTMSEGVKSIDSYAFQKCTSLSSVKIPSSVTAIGKAPFMGCNELKSLVVAEGNGVYHSAGNCLIQTQSKILILGLSNAVIPADGSVTQIAEEAFRDCAALTSIAIPSAVVSIGEDAFLGCSLLQYTVHEGGKYLGSATNPHLYLAAVTDRSITSFAIAQTAKIIGRDAFADCLALTSITIPASVMRIDDRAFWNCMALATVTIESDSVLTRIGDYAFHGCKQLESFAIPATVSYIGCEAFMDCDRLSAVHFARIDGWCRVLGEKNVPCSDSIGDPERAALYLTSGSWVDGYGDYIWIRTEE